MGFSIGERDCGRVSCARGDRKTRFPYGMTQLALAHHPTQYAK